MTTYSKGQPVREWRPKKGVRHEILDARVYAFGALRALVSVGLVLAPRWTALARKQQPHFETLHVLRELSGAIGSPRRRADSRCFVIDEEQQSQIFSREDCYHELGLLPHAERQ